MSNEEATDHRGGVTLRAAAVSLAIILVSAPAIFYGEVVWRKPVTWYASGWSTGVPASWPLAVLFLLTAIGGLRVLRPLALTRRELLTVYCAVLVATPLFSIGVLFWALSQPISFHYFGQAFPDWERTFLHLIPSWFSPTSRAAVDGYFFGRSHVPWSEWFVPLTAWGSFICAVFLANLCLVALVQRPWISQERLAFPLAQIPLETVAAAGGDRAGHRRTHRGFWYGALVALLVTSLSSLSQRFPSLPSLPLNVRIMGAQVTGPAAAVGNLDIALYPWLLSLIYLIPKEIGFSVWTLWLVRLGLTALAIAHGAQPESTEGWWRYDFPAPYNQVVGAVLMLAAAALWRTRRHLVRALRMSLGRAHDRAVPREPLPYRWAFVGLVISLSWLVAFFVMAGCRLWFAVAFSAVITVAYLSYARIQSEAALDTSFWWFNDILIMPIGGKRFIAQEWISLYGAGWLSAPMPSFMLSACSLNALTAFKIADSAGLNVRRLTNLIILSFLAALIVGIILTLVVTYRIGFTELRGGIDDNIVAVVLRAYGHGVHGGILGYWDWEPSPLGVLYVGLGAVVCMLFTILRLRFLWWPFHPIGYVLANSLPISYGLFPFLFVWLLKVFVMRYGGLRLYRATLPFATGLIAGDALNLTLWNLASLVTKGHL